MTAALRLVRPPEDELSRLFAEEEKARRHLASILAAQAVERRRYADKHGLCILPSLATIKQVLARGGGG